MNILILGAGALGSLFGAFLSRTDAALALLTTNKAHARAIAENGLTLETLDGKEERYALNVFDSVEAVTTTPDLVLVMVKAYDTERAVSSVLKICGPETLFLTLQNGIGNFEMIARLVAGRPVALGTTTQGSSLLGPGRIKHGGNGLTCLGEGQDTLATRLRDIAALFEHAGIQTALSPSIETLVWEKLIVNACINPLTAILGAQNGIVCEKPSLAALCRVVIDESLSVAKARGVSIQTDMLDKVMAIAAATRANRSSMGQDIDRNKPTEIDAINGALVDFGKACRLQTPVNFALTQLVKALQS